MSNIPANIPLPRWQYPTWYYALSLTERVASLQESKDKASISPLQMAKATQRLQAWKAQKPFDQGTLFVDRLAMDTITEDDLLFLLAEPIATV